MATKKAKPKSKAKAQAKPKTVSVSAIGKLRKQAIALRDQADALATMINQLFGPTSAPAPVFVQGEKTGGPVAPPVTGKTASGTH